MSTAFVTGGTGFVGRNLIELLRTEGWDVIAVHRPSSRVAGLRELGVDLREADVLDSSALMRAMPDGVDAVFHAAAATGTWSGGNAQQTRTNVDGTRNVVEAALARKARRFVHTASVATYGTSAYTTRIDERTTSDAGTHWVNYLRTKWMGEQIVKQAAARGLDAVMLNPANIIGPHDTHNWSRLFKLVADGKLPGVPPGRGCWCDVRDVAHGHLMAALKGRSGENYLLGGVEASYFEVTRLAADILGAKAPPAIPAVALRALARVNEWISAFTKREPDITPEGAFMVCGTGVVDSSKAERELGYRSRPLRPMVEDTLAWMRSEGTISATANS